MEDKLDNEKAHGAIMVTLTQVGDEIKSLNNTVCGYMHRADAQFQDYQSELKILHKRITDNIKEMSGKIKKVESDSNKKIEIVKNKVDKASMFISAVAVLAVIVVGALKLLHELGVIGK